MRADIVRQCYLPVIEKIKFFQNKDPDFLWAFLTSLKPMTVYSKDILYRQGDHPEEIFFIEKGRVKLLYDVSEGEEIPRNIPFNMYVEGAYFGEMEMFLKAYKDLGRDGTALVDCECSLLVMQSHEFRQYMKAFPVIRGHMKEISIRRSAHHLKAIEETKKRAAEKNLKGLNPELFLRGRHILDDLLKKRRNRIKGPSVIDDLAIAKRGNEKLLALEKKNREEKGLDVEDDDDIGTDTSNEDSPEASLIKTEYSSSSDSDKAYSYGEELDKD